MKPGKIFSFWENHGIPSQLEWNQVVKLCNYLVDNYGFTFRKAGKGSHWILAHDLLKDYYEQLNCNYAGEYTVCMKNRKCKRIYLKHIFEAYNFIREIYDE